MVDNKSGVIYNTQRDDFIVVEGKIEVFSEIEFWIEYMKLKERVLATELNGVREMRARLEKRKATGG